MSDSMEPCVAREPRENDQGMEPCVPETGYGGHKVYIRKVENGFIIEVGCKTFVADTWAKVSKGLELYFRDPGTAYKEYIRD